MKPSTRGRRRTGEAGIELARCCFPLCALNAIKRLRHPSMHFCHLVDLVALRRVSICFLIAIIYGSASSPVCVHSGRASLGELVARGREYLLGLARLIEIRRRSECRLISTGLAKMSIEHRQPVMPAHSALFDAILNSEEEQVWRVLDSASPQQRQQLFAYCGNECEHKRTALQAAVLFRPLEVAQCLLEAGCPADVTTGFGYTPLLALSELPAEEVTNGGEPVVEAMELLLHHGANLEAATLGLQQRPMHLAAEFGSEVTVGWLASKGARLNVRDSQGFTPLHYAADTG